MTYTKVLFLFIVGFIVSLSVWINGAGLEQNDMSNSGYQVAGLLGTVFFLIATVFSLFLGRRKSRRKQ